MPHRLSLISHPFHNGLEGVDMGAGPLRLLADPDLPAIELGFEQLEVAAAAITAFDPALDADGRMARAALDVLRTVAREALGQRAG